MRERVCVKCGEWVTVVEGRIFYFCFLLVLHVPPQVIYLCVLSGDNKVAFAFAFALKIPTWRVSWTTYPQPCSCYMWNAKLTLKVSSQLCNSGGGCSRDGMRWRGTLLTTGGGLDRPLRGDGGLKECLHNNKWFCKSSVKPYNVSTTGRLSIYSQFDTRETFYSVPKYSLKQM
jgi:hypothetical protein